MVTRVNIAAVYCRVYIYIYMYYIYGPKSKVNSETFLNNDTKNVTNLHYFCLSILSI